MSDSKKSSTISKIYKTRQACVKENKGKNVICTGSNLGGTSTAIPVTKTANKSSNKGGRKYKKRRTRRRRRTRKRKSKKLKKTKRRRKRK